LGLLLLPLIVVVSLCIFNSLLPFYLERKIYKDPDKIIPAQAALVLGASVTSKKEPSGVLKERLEKAAFLYHTGRVQKLIVSGDNSKLYYDEVNVMKDYLIKKRVSPEDIFMDHAGINTRNSLIHTRYIYGAKRVIIVTQEYHLYRALMIAQMLDMEANGYPADMGFYKTNFSSRAREYFARMKDAVLLYRFDPEVMKTVRKYPLSGNGRKTWNAGD